MMAEIVTSRGDIIKVDDDDFHWLSGFSWSLRDRKKPSAPSARFPKTGRVVYMHHMIFGNPLFGMVIDHKNGNKLDNRRCNLRIADRTQNGWNRSARSDGHKRGVMFQKDIQKWVSYISAHGLRYHLGSFHSREDAIAAREAAEIKYCGEFSPLMCR